MKTQSTIRPNKFKINDLGRFKEVILCENIIETQNEEGGTLYEYDMSMITTQSQTRDDLIADFVHLKYTHDQEIALLNKGLQDVNDVEYIAYRNYVSECKVFVK
jgi:hypothetical protein